MWADVWWIKKSDGYKCLEETKSPYKVSIKEKKWIFWFSFEIIEKKGWIEFDSDVANDFFWTLWDFGPQSWVYKTFLTGISLTTSSGCMRVHCPLLALFGLFFRCSYPIFCLCSMKLKKPPFSFLLNSAFNNNFFSFFFYYQSVFCSSSDAFLSSISVIDPFYGLFFKKIFFLYFMRIVKR